MPDYLWPQIQRGAITMVVTATWGDIHSIALRFMVRSLQREALL